LKNERRKEKENSKIKKASSSRDFSRSPQGENLGRGRGLCTYISVLSVYIFLPVLFLQKMLFFYKTTNS